MKFDIIRQTLKKAGEKIKHLKEQGTNDEDIELPKIENDEDKIKMEISLLSVFKATLVIIAVLFLKDIFIELKIINILLILLMALFLSAIITPTVVYFHNHTFQALVPVAKKIKAPPFIIRWLKNGMSEAMAIILILLTVVGFVLFVIINIIPIMGKEMLSIATDLKNWAENFTANNNIPFLNSFLENANTDEIIKTITDNIQQIASNLSDFAKTGVNIIIGTATTIFNTVLVLLLSFFLTLERKDTNKFFHSMFSEKYQEYISKKTIIVQKKISEWIHGQMLLAFSVVILVYISFKIIFPIFGISGMSEYALALALIFGLAEFVPYVGPFVSFMISAPIAFNQSVATGLALVIFYGIFQFIEGNFLVTIIMKEAVGLPPTVTILAILVGANVPNHPILGMLLAVPVVTILSTFFHDFTQINRQRLQKK